MLYKTLFLPIKVCHFRTFDYMKMKKVALLKLYIKDSNEWYDAGTFVLDSPVVRVGRSDSCEVTIANRSISRNHATLYYITDAFHSDYLIQDGVPTEIDKDKDIKIILSRCGVYINGHRKLQAGEKYLLKDNDEIHLIKNSIKLIYIKFDKPVITKNFLETYVPVEHQTDEE